MKREAAFLGRGWAFPPSFSAGGAEVMTVSGADDVHESLGILLGTVPGERVMLEEYGCDLHGLVFAELDQGLMSSIEWRIRSAILEYEPRVDVESVDISQDETEPHCLNIHLRYTVRGTNSRFNMVFPFYLMEAALPGP